jgi:hypothetical protein
LAFQITVAANITARTPSAANKMVLIELFAWGTLGRVAVVIEKSLA